MLTRYIVIYKLDTFEQVFGTESFSSVLKRKRKSWNWKSNMANA